MFLRHPQEERLEGGCPPVPGWGACWLRAVLGDAQRPPVLGLAPHGGSLVRTAGCKAPGSWRLCRSVPCLRTGCPGPRLDTLLGSAVHGEAPSS